MRLVVALGGNALRRREQPLTARNQLADLLRASSRSAAAAFRWRARGQVATAQLAGIAFAAGSMDPKVEAARACQPATTS